MSRVISPLKVGGFVLAALFLAVALLLFFSSTTLFTRTQTYIMYFDDSVKGLSVGSSVKYKGVPIGEVKKIYISYNQAATSARVPVLIEIDAELLKQLAELHHVVEDKVIEKEIQKGLRAQLQMESFITGLLFVEFNYYPNTPPEYFQQRNVYTEVPTVAAPFSQIGNSANDLVARLSAVDYVGLAEELKGLAASLRQIEYGRISKSLGGSLESIQSILARADEKDLGKNLGLLAENLGRATGPEGDITQTMKSLKTTSDNFGRLSGELDMALKGDSQMGSQLQRLVGNLSQASEAIGRLADYLERHPNALLTGKQADSDEK